MQFLKINIANTLLIFFFSLSSFVYAIDNDNILPPEKAYKASATIDNEYIKTTYDIKDGYYLYHSKFQFKSDDENIKLSNNIIIPNGVEKTDEFFGKISIHRKTLEIKIPYVANKKNQNFNLEVTSQGCADIGICYPPFTQKISLKTPENITIAKQKNPIDLKPKFSIAPDNNTNNLPNDDILPPEKAFILNTQNEKGRFIVSFDIKPQHYLYKDKFKVSIVDGNKNIKFGKIKYNKAKLKKDPFIEGGEAYVYFNTASLEIPVIGDNKKQTTKIKIDYQGCAEDKICYPPQSQTLSLNLKPVTAVDNNTGNNITTDDTSNDNNNEMISEQDRLSAMIENSNIFWVILAFFGLGLLLTFTPCVLPMVPILSNIIMGQKSISTSKSFVLSVIYVLAMALTYTILGVIIGLSGSNIQAALQNPYVIGSFSFLLILLSLSMFGLYELQMPAFIQNKINNFSNRQQGGTYVGVAIMGFLSALIVGPCVTAPLVGVLMYIAQTGDGVIGGIILFSLSMGMGAPLILIGSSAGKFLPKAGSWMDTIKSIFGVMLLATAIWMLDRVVPFFITMVLVAVLSIGIAYFSGLFDKSSTDTPTIKNRLIKIISLMFFLYGIITLVGAFMGGDDLLQPIPNIKNNMQQQTNEHLEFKKIKNLSQLNQKLSQAKQKKQEVMLDFYADWCVSCVEMEKLTFAKPAVQQALQGVLLLQADVTKNDEQDKELLQHFKIFGPPAIIFYNKQGITNSHQRVVGFMNENDFIKHIKAVYK